MRGARCRCCCAALPACVPVVLASAAAMPRPAASAAVADTDGPLFISRRQPHPYSGVGSGGGSHGGGSPASPCRHTGQRRRPRPRWRRSRSRSTPAAPSCERAWIAVLGQFLELCPDFSAHRCWIGARPTIPRLVALRGLPHCPTAIARPVSLQRQRTGLPASSPVWLTSLSSRLPTLPAAPNRSSFVRCRRCRSPLRHCVFPLIHGRWFNLGSSGSARGDSAQSRHYGRVPFSCFRLPLGLLDCSGAPSASSPAWGRTRSQSPALRRPSGAQRGANSNGDVDSGGSQIQPNRPNAPAALRAPLGRIPVDRSD